MPGLYNTKYRKHFLYLQAKLNQTVKRVHRFRLFYCNSVDILICIHFISILFILQKYYGQSHCDCWRPQSGRKTSLYTVNINIVKMINCICNRSRNTELRSMCRYNLIKTLCNLDLFAIFIKWHLHIWKKDNCKLNQKQRWKTATMMSQNWPWNCW